ncbi:MAG TPA: hypothetical protein VEZ55_16335 [Chitinophagaceae bacterium]|jgi:hypothetical protein|nr:hypothetical protein [Chitinophagaceae bacterium]
MKQFLAFCMAVLVGACGGTKNSKEDEGFSYNSFSEKFRKATVPFQLTDTLLQNNKDTAAIRDQSFASMIPDSISSKIFGKGAKVKYVPLWRIDAPENEQYFIVKGMTGKTKAALLLVFDKNEVGTVMPFLVPDSDASTSQVSSVDKSYSISKNVYQKNPGDATAEGKDVFIYNKDLKAFTLIMTDPLDEKSLELLNPIDTFPKLHKFAGDYTQDKRNIVSIRDGRKANTVSVFVHIEKGDCTGEVKGDAELTSATTAVYRQSGDPCVLQLNFSSSAVQLSELEACGSRRGLECIFEGSFKRKKEKKAKDASTKKDQSKK